MPSTAALIGFSAAALLLLVLPGPAVMFITARSASQGRRAGIASLLGVHTGTLVHLLAAVAGLSAVLVASATTFMIVKYVGALYLIGLGIRTIARRGEITAERGLRERSLRRLYLDGVVVNVFNPKTALFFLAFLPQFVDRSGSPVWIQTLVFGAVFIALGLCSDGAYALAGARLGGWLRRHPVVERRSPVVEGGVMVGLGLVALAVPHRSTDRH